MYIVHCTNTIQSRLTKRTAPILTGVTRTTPAGVQACRGGSGGTLYPQCGSRIAPGQFSGLLIRNLGIPTGGNWLKYLFPNLGFDSPAYSQSGNWFPQAFPLVGIDWNIWSQIWDLILQLIPRVGIDSHRNSHWWELIEIFDPKFGILFSSLFPEWELIPTGIPTGGNWLKYLFPNPRYL